MRKALNIPLEEFLRPFFGPASASACGFLTIERPEPSKGPKLETTLSGLPGLIDTPEKAQREKPGHLFCGELRRP